MLIERQLKLTKIRQGPLSQIEINKDYQEGALSEDELANSGLINKHFLQMIKDNRDICRVTLEFHSQLDLQFFVYFITFLFYLIDGS
jgi:hypothetical protein